MNIIYADQAATTQLDTDAYQAMKPYLLGAYGNPSQPYTHAQAARRALQQARADIAACIHAHPEEIFFTSGGTEANNWAVKGVLWKQAGTVVASAIEHRSVLAACRAAERLGCATVTVAPDSDGRIHPAALADSLTPDTRLVSVMLANNELGTLQPIRELTDIAHRHGAVFHTDAVAALGHVPVDVEALGVDLLSASAHKCNGPKGVGFLYVKRGTPIAPLLDGGAQENGLRAGTENVAAVVGMATALKKHSAALAQEQTYVAGLTHRLLAQLATSGIPHRRNGGGDTLPGTVSIAFPGQEGETLLHRLDLLGVQVSTGSACDGAHTRISPVLQAIRLEETLAKGTLRISLGADNTAAEVDTIVRCLTDILAP